MQKVVFASDQLPAELDERTRFTLWRNLCEEHFNSADLDFLTNGAFSVRVEFAQFGGVGLGQLAGTMRRIARSSRHIDADPSDMLCLALNRGRSAYACFQRDQEVTLDAGTATLITNWETIEVRANADTACSTLMVPRDRLLDLVANAEDLVAKPLDPESAALRHLRQYFDIVSGPGDLGKDSALIAHVSDTLLDLIVLVLGAGRYATQIARMRGLRAARAQQILAEIRAGFADPAFSPRKVAIKTHLSERYLQDLLQETGSTFTARVMELRLQKARAMLTNPRHDRLKVSEIAYACGFNEVSHFNRSFRARFGAPPTAYRGREGGGD
jgi:AraC-like DNA-binding protein